MVEVSKHVLAWANELQSFSARTAHHSWWALSVVLKRLWNFERACQTCARAFSQSRTNPKQFQAGDGRSSGISGRWCDVGFELKEHVERQG